MARLKNVRNELAALFSILEMTPTTDLEEIDRQYRRMASKHHPDKCGGDATKMAELNRARTELLDKLNMETVNSIYKCSHCKDTGFVSASVGLSEKTKKIKCKNC